MLLEPPTYTRDRGVVYCTFSYLISLDKLHFNLFIDFADYTINHLHLVVDSTVLDLMEKDYSMLETFHDYYNQGK